MRAETFPEALSSRLAAFIAEHIGLHFPSTRRAELMRGLDAAARELDFADSARYADWLLSTPSPGAHLHALACHLTIGETYFLREAKTLAAFSDHILPELLQSRRGGDQHLRLWSAACSSGEEPYTLAILLHELLPDWDDWRISILATDINERSLETAAAGIYREWSFRAMPTELRERYFIRMSEGRFAIRPDIRERVTFAGVNLAADVSPTDTVAPRAMDVIFCRNVLMYFAPDKARSLADRLYGSLTDGGWLAVSPSECSQTLFSRFATVNFPDAILYRKSSVTERVTAAHISELSGLQGPSGTSIRVAHSPSRRRQALPALSRAPTSTGRCAPDSTAGPEPTATEKPSSFATLARDLANQGRLSEALAWSEQWTAADKVDPASHYLRATVLQEMGDRNSARRALQRCLFLQPDFVLAHFALGTLERSEARHAEARRHFENTQALLRARAATEMLPDSEGLTVGGLAAILATLLAPAAAAAPATERSHERRQR